MRGRAQMSRPFVSAGPRAVDRNFPSRGSMGQPPGATATGEPHSGGGGGGGGGDGAGAGAGELSWSLPQPTIGPVVTNARRLSGRILFMFASTLEFFCGGLRPMLAPDVR